MLPAKIKRVESTRPTITLTCRPSRELGRLSRCDRRLARARRAVRQLTELGASKSSAIRQYLDLEPVASVVQFQSEMLHLGFVDGGEWREPPLILGSRFDWAEVTGEELQGEVDDIPNQRLDARAFGCHKAAAVADQGSHMSAVARGKVLEIEWLKPPEQD